MTRYSYLKYFFMLALPFNMCGLYAADNDTLSAKATYTGAIISAFIPGGGQLYQKRPIVGGLFLASEAATIGYFVNRQSVSSDYSLDAERFRALAAVILEADSAAQYLAGQYSVLADRTEFEARRVKYTAYNALMWATGVHIYNFMDAMDFGGVGLSARTGEKSPMLAGFLSATPFLGLGQLYNGRPGKAGVLAMTQTSLAVMAYGHQRLMSEASSKYNQMRDTTSAQYAYRADNLSYWKSQHDSNFSRRNTYLWVLLFTYIYSIFDAVVDAHLSDFDDKIRIGPDLSVGIDATGGVTVSACFALKR